MSATTNSGARIAGTGAAGFKPVVAMSHDFLAQTAKLPMAVHAKVLKWAMAFQIDPTAPGINYENIQSRDPNLRSVRIDLDWRGIVHKPERGNVYTLLYVDHHDAAYAWAKNRKLAINRVTGAMQVVVLETVTSVEEAPPVAALVEVPEVFPGGQGGANTPWASFEGLSDQHLLALGVPEDLLARVRRIATESELDGMQESLPLEAYEGLFLVGAGDSVDQVLGSRETRVDRAIDTEDFEAALLKPESQSRFVVVTDDAAMAAMLNAPLAQWRIFLHPTQHKLASGSRSGPVRVLGGAGTGKTVLAMHRAKWLAENATADGQKVLFTTFTKNLARDIEDNLKSLCSPRTMEKIEVKNLDAWVYAFLRARRYPHRIVYGRKEDAGAKAAWSTAMAARDSSLDLTEEFYDEEFDQVVLAQGVSSRDEYRAARRIGRGVTLARSKRDAVWPVFDEYRQQLSTRQLKEVDDAYRDATALLETEAAEAKASGKVSTQVYSSVIVDETQDFGTQSLRLLRAMVPCVNNDLFFVGDGHQRIYPRNRAAMSKCGIDIRGRSKKLYLNYRTTAEIRNQAVALLEGVDVDDLDDGHDELRRYKSLSHGPSHPMIQVDDLAAAIDETVRYLKNWREADASLNANDCVVSRTAAVLVRSTAVRSAIEQRCKSEGMSTVVIDKDQMMTAAPEAVRFATLHRAKGLEFDRVIVVGRRSALGDLEETAQERRLLYVALTRAKREAGLILF
ncbi:UvrD-helicase domain-containing protein [Paucibacter sp. B2R-40]|uniref:UvrD-helicase domain-containing protein n=1 Tax=Paucibacter sp. B2R-40 TaxID=2893554 RepID=UPI00398D36F2